MRKYSSEQMIHFGHRFKALGVLTAHHIYTMVMPMSLTLHLDDDSGNDNDDDEDDDNAMAVVLFRGSGLCPLTGGS